MKTEQGLPGRDWLPWVGAAMGLLFLGLLGYLQRERFLAGQNDFAQLYAGAQLSGTPQLYDPEANKAVHRRVLGTWLESVYYSRPPFYALVLRPLGRLSYKTAYWTLECLSALALIAFLKIWTPRCRELLLFAGMCLPLLANILAGQDLAFALLGAALAIEAHSLRIAAKAHRPAGVVFRGRLVVGAEVIGEAVESRVNQRAVQALVEIQNDELPIGFDIVRNAPEKPQVLHAP